MPVRDKPHTFAHWTVPVKKGEHAGKQFLLIDWLDRYTLHKRNLSLTNLIIINRDRLIDEGVDMADPNWENSCVFGSIGGTFYIFYQDSLDLETSRAKAP